MPSYHTKPFIDPDNDPVSPSAEKLYCPVSSISDRLEMIREERNMSRAAFAKSIAITPQGYRAMLISGRVTGPTALAIEYRHGFNHEWVKTGKGVMKANTWEMIRGEVEDSIFRDLNVFFQQKLKRTTPMVLNKDKNEREVN